MLSWRKVDIKDQLDSVIILLETETVENTSRPQPHLLYTNVPVRLAREVTRPKQLPSCQFRQHLPLLTACYWEKEQEKNPQTNYPYTATYREMWVTAYVPLQKEKAKATVSTWQNRRPKNHPLLYESLSSIITKNVTLCNQFYLNY